MNLEQVRAVAAHRAVEQVDKSGEDDQKRYATVIYQCIPLIHNSGLVQTIEFLRALSNKQKQKQAEVFLGQLAEHLGSVDGKVKDIKSLAERARTAPMADYMLLTREAMAALVWFRRFVQSILKLDPSQDEE